MVDYEDMRFLGRINDSRRWGIESVWWTGSRELASSLDGIVGRKNKSSITLRRGVLCYPSTRDVHEVVVDFPWSKRREREKSNSRRRTTTTKTGCNRGRGPRVLFLCVFASGLILSPFPSSSFLLFFLPLASKQR